MPDLDLIKQEEQGLGTGAGGFPIKLHRAHPLPNRPPSKGEGLYQLSYLYSRPLDGGGSGWG
jgi:hypothetical protein